MVCERRCWCMVSLRCRWAVVEQRRSSNTVQCCAVFDHTHHTCASHYMAFLTNRTPFFMGSAPRLLTPAVPLRELNCLRRRSWYLELLLAYFLPVMTPDSRSCDTANPPGQHQAPLSTRLSTRRKPAYHFTLLLLPLDSCLSHTKEHLDGHLDVVGGLAGKKCIAGVRHSGTAAASKVSHRTSPPNSATRLASYSFWLRTPRPVTPVQQQISSTAGR